MRVVFRFFQIMPRIHVFFVIFLLLNFFIWFGNALLFPQQFPPADDPAAHLIYTEQFFRGEWPPAPPSFYLLALTLHLITGISLPHILIYLPLLCLGVLIPSQVFYIFKTLLSPRVAVLLTPLSVGLYPLTAEIYSQGQLPEIVALTLAMTMIIALIKEKFLLAMFLMLGILATHHLTAIPLLIAFLFLTIIRFRSHWKKLVGIIIGLLLLALALWPTYFQAVRVYSQPLLSGKEDYDGIIPLMSAFRIWRSHGLNILFTFAGLLACFGSITRTRIHRMPLLFILAWLVSLALFSRIDFGDNFFSLRLIRTALFPGILITGIGAGFILRYFTIRGRVFLSGLLFILGVVALTKTINIEYSPSAYTRIKPSELETIEFIKKNSAMESFVLMPGGSPIWWEYLSGRKFIMASRAQANSQEAKILWEILDGKETELELIQSLGIKYIYQVSPETFFEIPYEQLMFDEKKLLATGRWKLALENERARIFELVPEEF